MPWQHCDVLFILDTEDCPECGLSKAQWTVEVDTTRVFQVARKVKLETTFALEPPEGEPHVETTFSIEPAEGEPHLETAFSIEAPAAR